MSIVLASITGLDGTLEHALDLSGIFVFAVSDATLAVRRGFDAVGIVVLAREVPAVFRPDTALTAIPAAAGATVAAWRPTSTAPGPPSPSPSPCS